MAIFRPLKNKLHIFAPNMEVKMLMSYMCLTVDSTILYWSAMYFKPNHFRRKVRRLSGGEGFKVNHPV